MIEYSVINLMNIASFLLSGIALVVSITTAWLMFFRKGRLKLTRPNVIFFGFDSTPSKPDPKIFFRALLYSTSKRGQLIESMHVRVSHGESVHNFSIWVHGQTKELSRGSGLFVGQDGVAANHHFLLTPDQDNYVFHSGDYQLEIFANIVGRNKPVLLFDTEIEITDGHAESLQSPPAGLYFDWGPDSKKYYSHIDNRSNHASQENLLTSEFSANDSNHKKETS